MAEERITKFQRWLDLIAYLVRRRVPASFDELMENVPSYAAQWRPGNARAQNAVRRKFERDKVQLRRLGIPLKTVQYSWHYGTEVREGYLIDKRDFYLPYLSLVSKATSSQEAVAQQRGHAPGSPSRGMSRRAPVGVQEVGLTEAEAKTSLDALLRVADIPSFPLAEEARSAFRKLAFDLDPAAFASGVPVLFVDRPGAEELRDRLRVLSDSLVARKRVRFRYHGIRRGEETNRDVAVYGLLFQRGHWYLIGHDQLRDDVRVFRVGRMDDVRPNTRSPGTPDYEVPKDFKLDDHLSREPWELGQRDEKPVVAEVLFHFPASLWVARNGHGTLVERRADGSEVRRFELYQVEPFLRWLLGFAGEAEPLTPPSLRAELRALAADMAEAHRAEQIGSNGDAAAAEVVDA